MGGVRLLVALVCIAGAVPAILYGAFCELMVVCSRWPGLPHSSLVPNRDELTERGRRFQRRGRRAGVIGIAAIVIASLLVSS